jgi:hypothetical protein
LTIKFNNGLGVRVPNSQLVLPEIAIDTNGKQFINTTLREVMLNPLVDVNFGDLPILGRQFFTSAYLSVNQDANTFTLWQANPTTDINLYPIVDNEVMSSYSITSSVPDPITTISAAAATPSSQNSNTNTGTVVGGAIGGIAGAVIIGVLAFCLLRKRPMSRRRHALNTAAEHNDLPTHNPSPQGLYEKPAGSSPTRQVFEMQ